MRLCDVNVLLHALRQDSPDHPAALAWLDQEINGSANYGVSPQILSSVIRLSTSTRIFRQPTPVSEALHFSSVLLNQGNAVVITPGASHWGIFSHYCQILDLAGNDIPDAWLAALAVEWDCEWISLDQGSKRFDRLRWKSPW